MTKPIGAQLQKDHTCQFTVWAPEKATMLLHIVAPVEQKIAMQKDKYGYFSVTLDDIEPGCRYYYMPENEKDYPDPASFYQPDGIHGPSEVIDQHFEWTDADWHNIPLKNQIMYEVHVGTFTEEGTFEAIVSRLDDIKATGINAIELMPVGQFPGKRNWGYDGVYPFAVQNSYGGPLGLKRLVDACHSKGIAVILDVVYNHMGPEGNYLSAFGPFFTKKYNTPWGEAINYDRAWADGVRNFFCYNALYWFRHFHIDGLRLDAIHEIYDFSAVHFLEFLHEAVKAEEQRFGKPFFLIAESDLNTPQIIKHPEAGGYGFDAVWLDDFHHALYVLLDKSGLERYVDFGKIEQLAKAYTNGFVHSGEYVQFRNKKYGRSSAGIAGDKFIIFNQNHDQIGNRGDGGRLSVLVSFQLQKVAAAAIMLAPYIPMLFMGEEYGDDTPFHYFIDHSDKQLIEAVRAGRKKEFEHFKGTSINDSDPYSEKTFTKSKIHWQKRHAGQHKLLLEWNKALIALRNNNNALRNFNKNDLRVYILSTECFALHRKGEGDTELLAIFNLSSEQINYLHTLFSENWNKVLDAADFQISVQVEDFFPDRIDGNPFIIPPSSVAVYANNV